MAKLITSMQKAAKYKNALRKDLNKLKKSNLYYAPLTKLTGVDNAKLFYKNISIIMNAYYSEIDTKANNISFLASKYERFDAKAKEAVEALGD